MTSKRKATDIDIFQPPIEIDDDDEHLPVVDLDCNQVRLEIQHFNSSRELNDINFQRAIGLSGKIYRKFMNKSGHDEGSSSKIYYNAVASFNKRDQAAMIPCSLVLCEVDSISLKKFMSPVLPSPPLLPHFVSSPLNSISPPPTAMHSPPAKKKKFSKPAGPYDVSGIELEGRDTESVPIYECCHEIRTKIKAFFRNVSSNESTFCREIAKTFPDDRFLTKLLNDFMKQKDPHGNESPAYHATYVFVEKLIFVKVDPRIRIVKTWKKVWAWRVNIPSRCHVCTDQISEGACEEKDT